MEKKTTGKSFILIKTRKCLYILIIGIIISLLTGQADSKSFSSSDLKLWGTIVGEKGRLYAVIEDSIQKQQKLYKQGDVLRNAKIKRILREKVILDIDGKDIILKLKIKKCHLGKRAKSTKTEQKLKLRGTITTHVKNYAVIEELRKKKQELYHEGDSIGNAFVKKILGKSVILDVFGKDEILFIDENKVNKPDKPAKKDKLSETYLQDIKITDDFTPYPNLLRSYVQGALKDTSFMEEIRIRPHFTNGKPDGLTFGRIKPDSVFTKLGFRSGDILQSLDGQNIRSANDAVGFFKKLMTSSDFRFQIRRERELIPIHYKISEEKVLLIQENRQDTANKHIKVSQSSEKDEKMSGTPTEADKPAKTDLQDIKHSKNIIPFSELSINHVQDVLTDTSFMKEIRIRPHFTNGKPDGLAFVKIKPDSVFAKMGFRHGDVLISLDRQNIISADDALEFYKKLKAFSDFRFQIRREKELITIYYKVSDEKISLIEENRQVIITTREPIKIIRSSESRKPLNQDRMNIITQTSDQNLQGTERFVSINFSNVAISVFIKFISDITGKEFTVSPRIKGNVNIASSSRIPVKEAYEVLKAVLDIHGYTLVDNKGVAKIIPFRKKRKIIAEPDSVIEDIIHLFGPVTPEQIPVQPSDQNTEQAEQQSVRIDFSNIDIDVFIRFVSEITGRNFVISPRVKGKVTIMSPSGISIDEVYRLFKIVLEIHGFTTAEAGAVTKIIPSDMRMKARKLIADSKSVIQKQTAVVKDISHNKTSPSHKPRNVSIDFRNVDIIIYIKFISELTGTNIVLHPKLKGNITLFCPRSIPVKKAGMLLDAVMGSGFYCFSTVDTGLATVFIPSSDPLIKVLQLGDAGYQKDNTATYDAMGKGSSQISGSESGNEKKFITIDFKNVDMDVLIEYISKLTNRNFVMASHNVCKKVTLSSADMSIKETCELFELTLEEHGLTSVDAGIVTKIIPN